MTIIKMYSVHFFGLVALMGILSGNLSPNAFVYSLEQGRIDNEEGIKLKEGRMIFEKMLEVLGGRQNLLKIRDSKLSVEYKVAPESANMLAVYYAKLPDKLRMDSTALGTMVFDGDKGWRLNPRTGSIRDMSKKELADFKDSAWATQGMLNPEMLDVHPALEGRVRLEGRDYVVISYTDWGGYDAVYVLIDSVTFFPYKLINMKSGKRTEVFHFDYRDIDGLKLPFSFNVYIEGQKAIRMTVREWKFNSNLEDSLFSKKSAKKQNDFHMDLSGFQDTAVEPELVYKVDPIYPELAKRAGISGKVVLRITIDEEGLVRDVIVLEGHPMFNSAAVEAVRQWRYRPTIREEKPVSVRTMVTVSFE